MSRKYGEDERAFLAIWRRLARGEVIPPVTFASKAQAQSVKMKAYAVLAPYRKGTQHDPELAIACEEYGISQDGATLHFGKKMLRQAARMLVNQLGITDEELKSPDELRAEREVAEMGQDMQEMLKKYLPGGGDV